MPETILNELPNAAPDSVHQPHDAPLAPLIEDALESHDRWRLVWRTLTHDGMLLAVLVPIAVLLGAWLILPQSPSEGSNDATAYSQWQAAARNGTGRAFGVLTNLGFFEVYASPALRLLAAAGLGVVMLRILQRAANFARPLTWDGGLMDETRIRISDGAPALDQLRDRLRSQRSRIFGNEPGAIGADRAPLADALTLAMHAGLALALSGVLLNAFTSWNDPHSVLNPGSVARIAGRLPAQLILAEPTPGIVQVNVDGVARELRLGQAAPLLDSLRLSASELLPVLRVSAQNASGRALQLTTSNYAPPTGETVMAFHGGEGERSAAITSENLLLVFSPDNDGTVTAYALNTGRQLARSPISGGIAVGNVSVNIAREYGAIIQAASHPGNGPIALGTLLAAITLPLVLLRPAQRLIIRRTGQNWTEFYGSGRNIRDWVRQLQQ